MKSIVLVYICKLWFCNNYVYMCIRWCGDLLGDTGGDALVQSTRHHSQTYTISRCTLDFCCSFVLEMFSPTLVAELVCVRVSLRTAARAE